MKTAVVFGLIVLVAFLGIYFMTNQSTNQQSQTPNFLTPTASPTVSINTPTPGGESQQVTNSTDEVTNAKSATIRTDKGDITVDLYASEAAKTVTNFATLAKRGYYNNLTFHRVEDWVIQGGDPSGNGSGGTSIYGPTFEDELNPNTPSYQAGYIRGVLAMANRGPNTNGSQFFILKKDTPLPHAYTIFGKVTNGLDVVDQVVVGTKILGIDITTQ